MMRLKGFFSLLLAIVASAALEQHKEVKYYL